MTANQKHYKSLKGRNEKEYENVLGAKTYVEALIGDERNRMNMEVIKDREEEWKLVSRRKASTDKTKEASTVFVEKLPLKAKAA